MKELYRLWITKKSRDFSWRIFCLYLYLTLVFVGLTVFLYVMLHGDIQWPLPIIYIAILLSVLIIPVDMLFKIIARHTPVEMDEFLRTRPVKHSDWSLFVLIDTVLEFEQWRLPLLCSLAYVVMLPWWAVLIALAMMFTYSVANAMLQNCWRRARGLKLRLPIAVTFVVWLSLICLVIWLSVSKSLFSYPTAIVMILCINLLVTASLFWYFDRMHGYNEDRSGGSNTKVRSLGDPSVWSIEWMQMLRGSNLRTMMIQPVIFIVLTVLQAVMKNHAPNATNMQWVFFYIAACTLAGLGFSVEANYFPAIWTKPWSVRDIITRKYWLNLALCACETVLLIPCVIWCNMEGGQLLALSLYFCGIIIPLSMLSCLWCNRADIFKTARIRYRGNSKMMFVSTLLMLVSWTVYYVTDRYLAPVWANAILGGMGLVGILLHPLYFRWVGRMWFNRRYEIMERWLNE